jgi:replicative DNA helicase
MTTETKKGRQAAIEIQVPPHSDEMELAVLGAGTIENRAVATISGWLTTRDFYRPSHRLIWDAMLELTKANHPVDELTLADLFHARGQLDDVGGLNALRALSRHVPSAANVGYYCREVKKYAQLRELASMSATISQRAMDPQEDPKLIAASLATLMGQQLRGMERRTTLDAPTAGGQWADWMEGLLVGDGASGYRTGIEKLDEVCRGIVPGRSYYLGGLTKMGKTTFAIHLACQMVFSQGFALDYVSVEQTHEELLTKMISWRSCQDVEKFLLELREYMDGKRFWPDADSEAFRAIQRTREKIVETREEFETKPVWLTVEGAPDVREIELMARARQMELESRGLDPHRYLLVVDYLQNISSGERRHDDRERISEVSRKLNGISKDLKIAVIVLFQFDREAEKAFVQSGAMPRFSNLRGSSQAGNDANHLWIMHRPLREDSDEQRAGWTVLVQELSRHGHIGRRVHMGCDLAKCRFWSWDGELPDDGKGDEDDNNNAPRKQRQKREEW